MPHQDKDVRSSLDPQMSPPPPLLSPLYWQNLSNLFLLPDLKVLAENLLKPRGAHTLLRAFILPSPKQPFGKQILRYFSTRHKTFLWKWVYKICACSVTQLCLTPCDSMGCSPPGILQARMLEWIAMPSSRGSSQSREQTQVSYVSCIARWVLYH